MMKIHARKLLLAMLLLIPVLLLCYLLVEPFRDMVRRMVRGGRTTSRVVRHGEPRLPQPARPGGRTVAQVMRLLQPALQPRIEDLFRRTNHDFPPARLALLGIKDRRRLEVWAAGSAGPWRHVTDYPFTAFSGTLGPKLREGDGQIPEGLYRIDVLNPNSQYHLSMRVSYPNEFDRRMAARDGRTDLGGDIYIHGRSASIGCIAIGDAAIEELFYMVAATGKHNVQVILAPSDLRTGVSPAPVRNLPWLDELYARISEEMRTYQLAEAPSDPQALRGQGRAGASR